MELNQAAQAAVDDLAQAQESFEAAKEQFERMPSDPGAEQQFRGATQALGIAAAIVDRSPEASALAADRGMALDEIIAEVREAGTELEARTPEAEPDTGARELDKEAALEL